MPIDVARARALTPACERLIHFNNAGASLPPEPVLDTVIGHLRREAEIGGYEAADEARDRLDSVYASVARLLGCAPDEVALMESSTTAWNAAFSSIPLAPGDRILTGRTEYVSNAIMMLRAEQRDGAIVELLDDDEHGQVSLDHLRARLDGDVKVVALTHVPTNGGLVNPAAEVGALAREAGALFVLDACQSAGQLPLDVETLGCDVLSATGRKFLRGPRGGGFLYVRQDVADRLTPTSLELRSAEWTSPRTFEIVPGARRFENFEHSVAVRLGLGAAVDHALSCGLDEIAARNRLLADRLRSGLSVLPGVKVHDKGVDRCAIVTFTVDGVPCNAVRDELGRQAINVWVSVADHAQFDMPERGLADLVRASVHYYNTEDEVDRVVAAVETLRARSATLSR